eukprot:PhM_4_TR10231/c0_g1_i1/m.89014
MSDPIRRDPTEFLRVIKKMAKESHWQKAILFASRGRMVGFQLGLEHYNHILYSQAVWGRALEITNVIRAMQEDQVRPDGVSYYYIVNGLANVDHGYSADFNVNARLSRIQHWRVALNALQCCRENGYDVTSSMYNSAIVTCTIPTIDRWKEASNVLCEMLEEEHTMHPNMVKFFHNCLVRNKRAVEATALLAAASEQKVKGYERVNLREVVAAKALSSSFSSSSSSLTAEDLSKIDEEEAIRFPGDCVPTDAQGIFRPMVWRGLWSKWHSIANKYRPHTALRRRQIAPKFSPAGIPGWKKK